MRYQLRDYRITPGAMTEFVSEWRAGVMPLRSQAGFEIVGAWSNPETNRFVWVVTHQGDFEEADRIAESPAVKTLLPDPNLKAVTDLMESIVYEKLKEGFILMYGLPSRLRFWRLPKQKRLLVKLSRIYGMIYTCVQGMTIHTLIRPELVDRRNPFEPLFQVFERGVFPDWERGSSPTCVSKT